MSLRLSLLCVALVSLYGSMGWCQQAPASVPLLQPGAPGQTTRTVTGPTVGTAHHEPTAADIDFMQGMIMHHSQAVEMVGLMQGRTRNPQLLELGQRVSISQGALSMVKDLFQTPGAGHDPQLFDFTADVEVTQQCEIDTMKNMLAKER